VLTSSNKPQAVSFVAYDQNVSAYRLWHFDTTGGTERRGQWDDASQSLKMQTHLPSAAITETSSETFPSNDRIESMTTSKTADGEVTRRWSAIKRSPPPELWSDLAVAIGPAALPDELSLLKKFEGQWTSRETAKPSVWAPGGHVKTTTENIVWILDGKFLLGRTYDEKEHLSTIWLATYEPSEKSYHFWFFSAEGWNGQWRVTWDASSRGFHWRSIDMPSGWIGSGYNRWINDGTFDNQIIIKDENGSVLFEATHEKRRKKELLDRFRNMD
jgi:hypothetical protein